MKTTRRIVMIVSYPTRLIIQFLLTASLSLLLLPCMGQGRKLTGHVPLIISHLKPAGSPAASKDIELVISLPLRNQPELNTLLHDLYDPSGKSYRHFLTPEQFNEQFAPTEADYQRVLSYAKACKFSVVNTPPNRTLVRVSASVANIEKALRVKLQTYKHPTENRSFYATNTEPSVDSSLPILHISGLDDYAQPRITLRSTPILSEKDIKGNGPSAPDGEAGRGPGGAFSGNDFRTAYAPGVSLNGAGQVVGLLSLDGYYPGDISNYETRSGFPAVPIQNVYLNGFTGTPSTTGFGNLETSMDMELAIAMAPGMSTLNVYGIRYSSPNIDEVLNEMANPTQGEQLPHQISTSYSVVYDPSVYQSFQQMAAQGQTFFGYSGDQGAYTTYTPGSKTDILPFPPGDYSYVTSVGGTQLTTASFDGTWSSETTWFGSGGGPSPWFTIPAWQQGMDVSSNLGSTTMRNCPDVSMVATNILVICNNGKMVNASGTSASTPLWAGFTALVNQQAAINHLPPVGFINPALYAIGRRPYYSSCFHDITTGSNASRNPSLYRAVPGYDLCTGWGTPNGINLINALALGIPFNTDVPTAATSLNNFVFDYARDMDGRIYFNQAKYGEAFRGWSELAGQGRTNTAPGCTSILSSLFVFIRGLDNRVYLNQAAFGHDYSGWFEVQGHGTTDAAPAAASIDNVVYVFIKGMDGKVYKNQATFGNGFGDWFPVPGTIQTNTAPAVVTHGKTVYVFIRGLDGRIYKNEADKGHSFGDWFPVPGTVLTDAAPAVATINNTLYVIIKGLDGKIYKNEADFGHSFGDWFELQGGGATDAAPTATSIGQSLFVFMKGRDGKVYLNQAAYRHAFSGWFDVGGRYY